MPDTQIYVIMTPAVLEETAGQGEYRAPSLKAEGFIHASASLEQVLWVANRRFREQPGLIVLVLNRDAIKAQVKDELTPRGEGPFPHIYGPLNLDAVSEMRELVRVEGQWAGWNALARPESQGDVRYLSFRPNLAVRDVAVSSAFYRDVLGLEVVAAFEDGSFALLKRDGAELALVRNATPSQQGAYLYVQGLDALHARCVAHGARIVNGLTAHPWGLRDFVVADPDGHWIAIGERIS